MDNEEIKYLVFDIESVPDAKLIKMAKYPDLDIDEKTAVIKFQEEILNNSGGTTFFIPVTFQYPISICMAKVRGDFSLVDIVSLDEPRFRTGEMTRLFWLGVEKTYNNSSLVSFNGRGFDIPLLELMAYRYGITARRHFKDKFASRYRFGTKHIDLQDWLSNYNAVRMAGGLNLLSKVIGKPGKMTTSGDDVYEMFLEGKIEEINNYCIHDVLDTYFVFLRTRVMLGELSVAKEEKVVKIAHDYIIEKSKSKPSLNEYLEHLSNSVPWPKDE